MPHGKLWVAEEDVVGGKKCWCHSLRHVQPKTLERVNLRQLRNFPELIRELSRSPELLPHQLRLSCFQSRYTGSCITCMCSTRFSFPSRSKTARLRSALLESNRQRYIYLKVLLCVRQRSSFNVSSSLYLLSTDGSRAAQVRRGLTKVPNTSSPKVPGRGGNLVPRNASRFDPYRRLYAKHLHHIARI